MMIFVTPEQTRGINMKTFGIVAVMLAFTFAASIWVNSNQPIRRYAPGPISHRPCQACEQLNQRNQGLIKTDLERAKQPASVGGFTK
jgi:hypothetical protein